ncbi:hypothetical protein [Bacillus sp. JCM 19041]|uniref:hypothetical protein n=1 Tax=Bacillus sp. JCM 19041 TaxID=1460637 RepID=UPI003369CF9B
MSDMLVPLYRLPKEKEASNDFNIRRALAPEKSIILDWVKNHFGQAWSDECDVAFSNAPVTCYIAIQDEELIGFACYDATMKNFFWTNWRTRKCTRSWCWQGAIVTMLPFNERNWLRIWNYRRRWSG